MSVRKPVSTSRFLLALSSALLLIAAFPGFNQPRCAWLALIPWLIALRTMNPAAAFGCSYLVGLVFFAGSLSWLSHVTLVGLVALSAFLALYLALFGLLVAWLKTRARGPLHSVLLASAWVSLEYLRSHVLSGFGWNLMGYSQAPILSIIQMADVTGVWGVSFLVVLVNVALADYLNWRNVRKGMGPVVLVSGLVLACWLYGLWALKYPARSDATVKVALVQGNIPQEQKWDERYQTDILDRYERLTRQAAGQRPDIIIWPEASVPGILGEDRLVTERITKLTRDVGVPVLLGAPLTAPHNGQPRYTNSAIVLKADGSIQARYDKTHLVPFGEFVPLSDQLPWLREALPPIGDFMPGREFSVFRIGQPPMPAFAALVCFEDAFPQISRRFARAGARWLVTITNDAWFGRTGAPYQHAQASTLRAVELRLPMVRAANTGWSGCIDAQGRWTSSVKDAHGTELFVDGVDVCTVAVPQRSDTVYARFGDWFAWLCLMLTAWSVAAYGTMKKRWKRKKT